MKNCLQVPPALRINKVLYTDRPMPAHVKLEQRIAWNLLLVLEKAGFHPVAVHDGEELTAAHSKVSAMELMFNLDDAYLFVEHSKPSSGTRQWIRFVFGNELDIVSDYSASDDDGFQKVMDKFNAEDYA